MVAFIAQAVGVHVGPGGWLLIYLTVNLAATMPGTPGQIGLFEAAAVLALVGQGVGQAQALAFALLYHAVHLVPLTLVGAAPLVRMRFWRGGAP